MVGCLSGDLRGGKQAIDGGVHGRSTMNNDTGHNEAIHYFYRVRGHSPLFTQMRYPFFYIFKILGFKIFYRGFASKYILLCSHLIKKDF